MALRKKKNTSKPLPKEQEVVTGENLKDENVVVTEELKVSSEAEILSTEAQALLAAKLEEKEAAEAKAKAKEKPRFISVQRNLWHPFQKVYVTMGMPGVMLTEDSWLKSQIERGLIRKV